MKRKDQEYAYERASMEYGLEKLVAFWKGSNKSYLQFVLLDYVVSK